MTEATHKTTGDPATPGYRPLPGSGPTRGGDLRTTVVAGLGIALGIFAGTFVADGTVQRMLAGQQSQVAQVSPQGIAVAPSPSIPAVSTPQAIAAATGTAVAAVPATEPAPAATPDASARVSQPEPKPLTAASVHSPVEIASAHTAPVIAGSKPAFVKTDDSPSTGPHKVAVVHHRRSGRRLASRRAHLSRRHGRGRHRPHFLEQAAQPALAPERIAALDRIADEPPAGFTVEGNLTVSNVDSLDGVVQTYEGESFALGNAASETTLVSWLQNPADLHYRCDQSGNCTLAHGRFVLGSAKRTK